MKAEIVTRNDIIRLVGHGMVAGFIIGLIIGGLMVYL